MDKKVLIIGASGQIGVDLVGSLQKKLGVENVIASDIREGDAFSNDTKFEILDALDKNAIEHVVKKHGVAEVYLLAAMLSATGEKYPLKAWDLNMQSLLNVLELGKEKMIEKIFWPSSIAVFGPGSPKFNTPQHCVMNPTTVYGISKVSGEQWCNYYHEKYGVDVRSIRYPGLIGHNAAPGGGTTDYAVSIFHSALKGETFSCYLSEDRSLPMMYMEDAIRATIDIMHAPTENVKIRESYNLAGISFTPKMIAEEIKKHIPNFEIEYQLDSRDGIAASWPSSVDESMTTNDWGWRAQYDLSLMVSTMIDELKKKEPVEV